jgi:hypothetical protein
MLSDIHRITMHSYLITSYQLYERCILWQNIYAVVQLEFLW